MSFIDWYQNRLLTYLNTYLQRRVFPCEFSSRRLFFKYVNIDETPYERMLNLLVWLTWSLKIRQNAAVVSVVY